MSRLRDIVRRFQDRRILIVGDVIVDHFIWGTVSRISPEAPVPVVNVTREEFLLGGSANVLKNVYALGGCGSLCGIIGRDDMGQRLLDLVRGLGAPLDGLVVGRRPTTVKTRIVAQHQQVVRFDRERVAPPSPDVLERMLGFLEREMGGFDAVMISDYAKGVVGKELMDRIRRLRRQAAGDGGEEMPLVVDPKPVNTECFHGATVVTPNHLEAAQMSGIPISSEERLWAAAREIRDRLRCRSVLITRGEAGMALLDGADQRVSVPAMAREVFDVTGAGDTVAATLALALASGATMTEAATLANHAAGVVVAKLGTASVTQEELLAALPEGG